MISCSEAVRRLWDYLERELDAGDRRRIEEHVAFCRRCCGEVEFAEELRSLIARAATVEIDPLVEERLSRFLKELEAGGTS